MEPIKIDNVQDLLNKYINKPVYIHLETTNGAYAGHFENKGVNVGAYFRNAKVSFTQAKIVGNGHAYRVGLKMEMGWIYAEGLTDWTVQEEQLLLAGHDDAGRLMVALQISESPFAY